MTLDDLQDALDTYGARIDDWPEHVAAAARSLLEDSPQARTLVSEAQALDGGLSALMAQPVRAPRGMADSILGKAGIVPPTAEVVPFPAPRVDPAPVAARNPWAQRRSWMVAAAAMVVCFLGGIVTVQTIFPGNADSESVYVSAVYGDLAW